MISPLGIRDKLIGIFVLIKVIPLVLLAWFAWNEVSRLSQTLETQVNLMAQSQPEHHSKSWGSGNGKFHPCIGYQIPRSH